MAFSCASSATLSSSTTMGSRFAGAFGSATFGVAFFFGLAPNMEKVKTRGKTQHSPSNSWLKQTISQCDKKQADLGTPQSQAN